MRLVVTAGFDGSVPALATSELLRRSGHSVVAVIVVTPFNLDRVKTMLKQRGISGLKKVASKLVPRERANDELNLQKKFLIDKEIHFTSLKTWCKLNQVNYIVVNNLNSGESIKFLNQSKPDAVLYAGGGILRSSFIEAANHKIVNNHSGPLPEVRGMNAVEWSILLGYEPSVTIHMIDRGIDTGEIISRVRLSFCKGDSIETIRAKAVICGIEEIVRLFYGLTDLNDLTKKQNEYSLDKRQCYILAPALRELLLWKLKGCLSD